MPDALAALVRHLATLEQTTPADAFDAEAQVRDAVIMQPLLPISPPQQHEDGSANDSRELRGFEWTTCLVRNTRFTAARFEDCSFEGVIFHECDLSGTSFINCLFRDCSILGGKSSSHVSFADCVLDGLVIAESIWDNLEVQRSRLGAVTLCNVRLRGGLLFQSCQRYKRTGRIVLTNVELTAARGLNELKQAGIAIQVDALLWRDLGDQYIRELGITELNSIDAPPILSSIADACGVLSQASNYRGVQDD